MWSAMVKQLHFEPHILELEATQWYGQIKLDMFRYCGSNGQAINKRK